MSYLRMIGGCRGSKWTYTREVLDITIPAVFRTSGHGSGSFLANLFFQSRIGASGVDVQGLRSTRHDHITAKVSVFMIHTTTEISKDDTEKENEEVTHGKATSRSFSLLLATSSASRVFQVSRTSAEGAQPRMPGWMSPANLTWGMCRLEQKMPSKSQIALALFLGSRCQHGKKGVRGEIGRTRMGRSRRGSRPGNSLLISTVARKSSEEKKEEGREGKSRRLCEKCGGKDAPHSADQKSP